MEPTNPNTPHLLTANEIASAFGVSKGKVYQLARTGKIRCYEIGERMIRFSPEDVRDFLERNRLPREGDE